MSSTQLEKDWDRKIERNRECKEMSEREKESKRERERERERVRSCQQLFT